MVVQRVGEEPVVGLLQIEKTGQQGMGASRNPVEAQQAVVVGVLQPFHHHL